MRNPGQQLQQQPHPDQPDKSELLFYVNRVTGLQRLCIPLGVDAEIIALAHVQGHPGFPCCYEIVSRFWFI